MRNKNNDTIILSFLWEILSQNQSKNEGDDLFLASYKVDPRTDIIKKNEPTRARWNSNNNNNDVYQTQLVIVKV